MKLYVIRHGQTRGNLEKLFLGINEDINETGIEQAKEAAKLVENLNIDLVVCSPAIRTRHTYKLLNIDNIPVIFDERLIERDFGVFENGSYLELDRKEFWSYHSTKYTGLETMKSVYNRTSECLDELKNKYAGKNILMVTHGGVCRAIYWYCNGVPEDGSVSFDRHKNCEIKEYEI